MSTQSVDGPVDEVRCIRRAGSVWSKCKCPDCGARRNRMDKLRRCGRPTAIADRDAGWAVFLRLTEAGWTPRAIASAYEVPAKSLETAAHKWSVEKTPTRFSQGTARRLLDGPVRAPVEGYVPSVGVTRRMRALAAVGWTNAEIGARAGVAGSVISDAQAARRPTVHAVTASSLVGAFDALSGRLGSSSRAVFRARGAGWAPPYAWAGLDIDDPSVVLPEYPGCDVPSLSRAEVRRVEARRARQRDGWEERKARRAERRARDESASPNG